MFGSSTLGSLPIGSVSSSTGTDRVVFLISSAKTTLKLTSKVGT